MSRREFGTTEDIVRWQYRRRQCLKWVRRFPWVPNTLGVFAAGLSLISVIPAQIGGWIALVSALAAFGAQFIPPDERSQDHKDLEGFLDQSVKASKKSKQGK